MAHYWYKGGVAANCNSNNNIPALLPSKTLPTSATRQISGSGGSRQSVNPWDMSTMRSDIQSSSPQVPRNYSSDGSYHSGSHNVQPSGQSRKTTNSIAPLPYQPPDYTSLGTGAHSGPSIPRERRKEGRSSRSTDKLDSKASSRSWSLSRDRTPSSSKSMQESDRQSHDRVRSTHSTTVMGAEKATRPRSRSQSRDRLLTTAISHTSDGRDMLSRDRNQSSSKSMQESDRQSHDRVRRTRSNETVTEAGKVNENPHPTSQSQSRDTLSTSVGGDMQGMYMCSSFIVSLCHHFSGSIACHFCNNILLYACLLGLYSDPSTNGPTELRDLYISDKRVSNSRLRLAGHSDATVNKDRVEDARDTCSEFNVGKEKKTRKVEDDTSTRSQSSQSSTPLQGIRLVCV